MEKDSSACGSSTKTIGIGSELGELITWIVTNNEPEPMSAMMPWGTVWTVNAHSLLDAICEIWGLEQEEVGRLVEKVNGVGNLPNEFNEEIEEV
jgi:hypothetical protein